MAREDSDADITAMVTDPYYFRALWKQRRDLIRMIGRSKKETIDGHTFLAHTNDHDVIRSLVSWNFIVPAVEPPFGEHEAVVSLLDFDIAYRITQQAREFAALEVNNVAGLDRAILILLRADRAPERRMGLTMMPTGGIIRFYELVMLLNKSEWAIRQAIARLQARGLVDAHFVLDETGRVFHGMSEVQVNDRGIFFLESGAVAMTFNNISIVDSNVGVVSLQSTLTNIDVRIGALRQEGNDAVAEALSRVTEAVAGALLPEVEKRDMLDQLEVLSDQAAKAPATRKSSSIKGALAFLDKAMGSIANLATIWSAFGPVVTTFLRP